MILAGVIAALPAVSARAATSLADNEATAAYLKAELVGAKGAVNAFPAAIAAVEAFAARLRTECPGVLVGAPKPAPGANAGAAEVPQEVAGAAFTVGERSEYERRRRFAHAVSSLRWSDATLTRLVREYVGTEVSLAKTAVPNLCSDMRSWVVGGYTTAPVATQGYVRHQAKLERETIGDQERIIRRLERFENPADKRIVMHIEAVERSAVLKFIPRVRAAVAKVTEVLETAPPA
jgi:hypothetical protein